LNNENENSAGYCRRLSLKQQTMSKLKINGKELRAMGFPEGPVISVAMKVMEKQFKHHTK